MTEIGESRGMIRRGIDHIRGSMALAKEEATAINQAKGELLGGLEALQTAVNLFRQAQVSFEKVAELHNRTDREILAGCSLFRSVALGGAPQEVEDMINKLTMGADMLEPIGRNGTNIARALGNLSGSLTELRVPIDDTGVNTISQNSVAMNHYANNVAPLHIDTAEAWVRTL